MGRRPNTQTQDPEVEVSKEEEVVVVNTPEVEVNKEEEEQAIPDSVDAILKSYSTYPKLYVNLKGGVFTESTPEYIRQDAVLYKNKYYKHK